MKKRLDSLRIERFRQIKELSIPALGHVNLVVGRNNSGKSTLLEALRIYASAAAPALLEELLIAHGELQVAQPQRDGLFTPEPAAALCNLFSGRKFPPNYGDSIYIGDAAKEHFVSLAHLYQLVEELDEKGQDGRPARIRRVRQVTREEAKNWPSEFDAVAVYEAIEIRTSEPSETWVIRFGTLFGDQRRDSAYDRQAQKVPCCYVAPGVLTDLQLAEAWDGVVLTEGERIAIDALRFIEPPVQALAFVQRANSGSLRHATKNVLYDHRVAVLKLEGVESPVPLQSMGDGMARVLQVILSGLRAEDGLLLVDEFENGLHHSVQVKVWEMLFNLAQTRGLQIFATTHSDDCVRAFSRVAQANTAVDGKLLKLERMPDDGQTVAAALGEDDLSNLLDADIEVRG